MMSLAARKRSPTRKRCEALAAVSIRLALVPLTFAAGCDLNDNTFHVEGKAPSASPPPSLYAYPYPPNPPLASVQDLRAFVDHYTDQDRFVLLDVWAGWSRRCRAEQVEIAGLQSDLDDAGLQVVSCNLDPASQWSSRTVPSLQGAGANYPCLVLKSDERSALRSWLGVDWRYDLPARFLIDRKGEVVARLLSDSAIETVRHETRRLARQAGGAQLVASGESSASFGGKLINIRTGAWQSLPGPASESVGPESVSREFIRFVGNEVDRSSDPSIAVLPFTSARDRKRPAAYGFAFARRIVEGLRRDGYSDLVGPADTQHMVDDLGVSPLAIDVDPTLIRGHLDVDYLVTGWLGDSFSDTAATLFVKNAGDD